MNNKIFIKDWASLKPYTKQASSDLYYLKLANQVKEVLIKRKVEFAPYINTDEINILACFITSYLEDLISETNIWSSFIDLHNDLYEKYLPFYNLDDYIEHEVNEQDISFLIWYFCNKVQDNKFVIPFNAFIMESAQAIFKILDDAWEFAPENHLLQSCYAIDSNETDYYKARNIIDILLFRSYLFYPDTALKLKNAQKTILEQKKDVDSNTLMYMLNESRDSILHESYTSLMSMNGSMWAANVVNEVPIARYFAEQSPKINGAFRYKGQDIANIHLEHIASGKKFKMTKKSFTETNVFKTVDTAFYLGIVKWNDEWWFSGIVFNIENTKEIAEQEKKHQTSLKSVSFLDSDSTKVQEFIDLQYKAFLKFNGGSPIAFMHKDKIEPFCNEYLKFYNNSLNLSEKEIKDSKEKHKDLISNEPNDFNEYTDYGLVFFNEISGLEMAFGINSAFLMDNNPYFDDSETGKAITILFTDKSISTELAYFAIDNGLDKLPFFKSDLGMLFLRDIDFLFRFWKQESYTSKPNVSVV